MKRCHAFKLASITHDYTYIHAYYRIGHRVTGIRRKLGADEGSWERVLCIPPPRRVISRRFRAKSS